MKTYTVNFGVDQVWETMRIGFEVNYTADAASDLFVDNVIFTRVQDVAPAAPSATLSHDGGVTTVTVDDNGAASYDVYFAGSAFTETSDGKFLGTLTAETGLSLTHSIKAPLPSMAKTYEAHFGIIAKSA